jgi:PhzF family phenazine biosynthesis protein
VTRGRDFRQVDVFSAEPYLGNPVAVVLDGDGLDDDAMRRFAAWTNLSETTFVVPPSSPGADYGLRIFTPSGELPFAGHPTLGSAHAWLEAGGSPASADLVVQECPIGLVELRRTGGGLAFAAPELRRTGPLEDEVLGRVVAALGVAAEDVVAHQWVDNGPGWAAVRLPSARHVLALDPDDELMRDLMVGVVGDHEDGGGHRYEVRAFALPAGVREDPVTGSLNAGLAQWLTGAGEAPASYTVSQGTRLGRRGVVRIEAVDGRVWVGGASVTCIRGTVDL